MRLLTYESVETLIKQRVEAKAKIFGQEVTVSEKDVGPPVFKIKPSLFAELYGDWIMPLTKEVQLMYLLRRLDWILCPANISVRVCHGMKAQSEVLLAKRCWEEPFVEFLEVIWSSFLFFFYLIFRGKLILVWPYVKPLLQNYLDANRKFSICSVLFLSIFVFLTLWFHTVGLAMLLQCSNLPCLSWIKNGG